MREDALSIAVSAHELWLSSVGREGQRLSLLDADLRGADLSGRRLSEADFSGSDLSAASLVGAELVRACLFGAVLSDADLSQANLVKAEFDNAVLIRARLRGVQGAKASFAGANLAEADLSSADLSASYLLDVNLEGASLVGTQLYGAGVDGARMRGADLRGATGLDYIHVRSIELGDEGKSQLLTDDEALAWLRRAAAPDPPRASGEEDAPEGHFALYFPGPSDLDRLDTAVAKWAGQAANLLAVVRAFRQEADDRRIRVYGVLVEDVSNADTVRSECAELIRSRSKGDASVDVGVASTELSTAQRQLFDAGIVLWEIADDG